MPVYYVNWSIFGYLYQIYPREGWFSQLYINILQGLPVKAWKYYNATTLGQWNGYYTQVNSYNIYVSSRISSYDVWLLNNVYLFYFR